MILSGTLEDVDSGKIQISASELNIDRGLISSYTAGTGESADIAIDAESISVRGSGVASFQRLVARAFSADLTPGNDVSGITTFTSNLGAAGDIEIDSQNFSLSNGAFIASIAYDGGKSSDIAIDATEEITISSSGLLSSSAADSFGNTGDVIVQTQKLLVRDSSLVSAATLGQGAGGDVTIRATELVELKRSSANFILPTIIFTNSVFLNSGNAGNLSIETANLTIEDGAQISSASGLLSEQGIIPFGGTGGDINIQAEYIKVSGDSPEGRFPSGIISDTRSDSPAGNINLNTGSFILEGQAVVSASSIGTGDGGSLTIDAAKSMHLSGIGQENLLILIQNSLSPETLSIGDIRGGLYTVGFAGNTRDISIKTPVLSLDNGSLISTATFGAGNAGNINIETSKLNIVRSVISSTTLGAGDAGNIKINTRELQLRNSGTIVTSNLGLGKAGDMIINATESIELFNDRDYTNPFSLQGGIITSKIGEGATGAGNLLIDTKNLVVRNGLDISIANERALQPIEVNESASAANASELAIEPNSSIIRVSESILITGSSADNKYVSSINSSTQTNIPANNIQIITPRLTVSDGADISVNSNSTGAAGRLEIIAKQMFLESGGTLNANTISGKGGNISLTIADFLQMSDRSQITTNALNQGDGGNITIDTDFIVTLPESSITATAIAGRGGNINIEAKEIFVVSTNQISASSELGIDGEVQISRFANNLRNEFSDLPEEPLDITNHMVSHCGTENLSDRSSFVYSGKGALPASSFNGNVDSDGFFVDWGDETSEFQLDRVSQPKQTALVEATGWLISDRGKVILTARKPNSSLFPSYQAVCPFNNY